MPGAAQENATIAVVLRHFPSILEGGRLGLHNIYPDPDGIATEKVLEKSVLHDSIEHNGELSAFLLLVRAGARDPFSGERELKRIRRNLVRSGAEPRSVELLSGQKASGRCLTARLPSRGCFRRRMRRHASASPWR